jgi:hypothetical protein
VREISRALFSIGETEMKQCYVTGERKRESARKAWETRRARYGQIGYENKSGPKPGHKWDQDVIKRRNDSNAESNKNPEVAARRVAGQHKISSQKSATLKARYASGAITNWSDGKNADTIKAKLPSACKAGWVKLKADKIAYGKWKDGLLKSHYRRPSGLEKQVISLGIDGLEYTGDSNFWIRLGPQNERAKNPDFVVKPFRKTHAVVEVFGAEGWFHTRAEADDLLQLYAEKGIKCLIVWEKELKNLEAVRSKIMSFLSI